MQELNIRRLPLKQNVNFFNFPNHIIKDLRLSVYRTLKYKKKVHICNINVILVNNKKIKELNKRFRNVNNVTDVISFTINSSPLLGDIYIAREQSKLQAKQQGHSWKKELSYLIIHGVLHLFGYTDYTIKERKKMFRLQDSIWNSLYS